MTLRTHPNWHTPRRAAENALLFCVILSALALLPTLLCIALTVKVVL